MDPIQEILETVRAVRQAQIEARQTQLKAVNTYRRIIVIGGFGFAILLIAYVIWCYVIIAHSK
jgi:hypothetical protein